MIQWGIWIVGEMNNDGKIKNIKMYKDVFTVPAKSR